MSSIFIDRAKAAELLGYTPRHFTRKFVDTGLLKVQVFRVGGGPSSNGKPHHRFLTADVMKLAAENN